MGRVIDSKFSNNDYVNDDNILKLAMKYSCIILKNEYKSILNDWSIYYDEHGISLFEINKYHKMRRNDFFKKTGIEYKISDYPNIYNNNKIIPDGGIIWLENKKNKNKYPIVISEMKYQGTNEGRKNNGLKEQSVGNAIERCGKYANVFGTLYEFDEIFPYIVFVHGDDFNFDVNDLPFNNKNKTQGAKLIECNGGLTCFNKLFTRDKLIGYRKMRPYTMLVQKDSWEIERLKENILTISKDSIDYFIENK